MTAHSLALPASLLLLALALAACGGSSDEATSAAAPVESTATDEAESGGSGSAGGGGEGASEPSDEELVTVAIEGLVVDPDNEYVCSEVVSPELLETAYGDLQGCLKGRRAVTLAESLEISGLKVEGERATAVATPKGGLYDADKLEILAVREGDEWRIDRFVADIPVGP